MKLNAWLRAVRIKTLPSSVLASIGGTLYSVLVGYSFDAWLAILTYIGIIFAHMSVDLINDYFDYKSGLDLDVKRTPFSGGTGVIVEGLLSPQAVYRAGILTLILGLIIGIYLSLLKGIMVLILTLFGALTIYLYSSHLANIGLGEFFVTLKGMFVFLGSFYVMSQKILWEAMLIGLIYGLVSASILYSNQIPDIDADSKHGRKNLTVRLGVGKLHLGYGIFIGLLYILIIISVIIGILPLLSLITLLGLIYHIKAYNGIKNKQNNNVIPHLGQSVMGGRIIDTLLTLSIFLKIIGI
jgi:1,4-dihydroxy-2-naphthoate octaprenyltransferase